MLIRWLIDYWYWLMIAFFGAPLIKKDIGRPASLKEKLTFPTVVLFKEIYAKNVILPWNFMRFQLPLMYRTQILYYFPLLLFFLLVQSPYFYFWFFLFVWHPLKLSFRYQSFKRVSTIRSNFKIPKTSVAVSKKSKPLY